MAWTVLETVGSIDTFTGRRNNFESARRLHSLTTSFLALAADGGASSVDDLGPVENNHERRASLVHGALREARGCAGSEASTSKERVG
jgi:hypothetical protein